MTTRPAIDRLADIVERVEGELTEVEDVALSRADGEFVVDISLRLSPPSSAADAAPHPDGATDGGTAPPDDRNDHRDAGIPAVRPVGSLPATVAARPSSGVVADRSGVTGAAAAAVGDHLPPGVGGALDDLGAFALEHAPASAAVTGSVATDMDDGASDEPGDEAGGEDADRRPDGAAVECRVSGCGETFDTDHAMKIHAAKAHDEGDERAPHRDPEQLRSVYEECETFEEMTEALDVDVTPQTVRRNMMSMGIHDPAEDDAGADPGAADGTTAGSPARDDAEAGDDALEGGDDAVEGSDDGTPEGGDGDDFDDDDSASADGDESASADAADPASAGGDVTEAPADADSERAGGADDGEGAATGDRDADASGEGDFAAEVAGEGTPTVPPAVQEVLPPSVDGRELATAVREADTLYDVTEAIDVDRETARSLLDELGLLELVHGRVATKPDRDDRKDEVERRLRERASGD